MYGYFQGNIIESLDKLQQQLKLEEAVDERLAATESNKEVSFILKEIFHQISILSISQRHMIPLILCNGQRKNLERN